MLRKPSDDMEDFSVKAYAERGSELFGEFYFDCTGCGVKHVSTTRRPFEFVCIESTDDGDCNTWFRVK